eukprot:4040567-Pleurochrysis_carterae.AAC.2
MMTFFDFCCDMHGQLACMAEDPATCAETLSQVRAERSLEGTGFTKVTVALNNPIPVHNDYGFET